MDALDRPVNGIFDSSFEGDPCTKMLQAWSSTFYILVGVHLVVAIAPLGMAFVPFDIQTLPIIWGLASIPIAQVMLMSTWIGMTTGNLIRKMASSTLAILYISFWSALGQVFMSSEATTDLIIPVYLQNTAFLLVFLAVLSMGLAGASRLVGSIRFAKEADLQLANPQFRYSLASLLALTTTTSLILGLVRASNASANDGLMVALYLLAIVVFAVNILATIWATLGDGRVVRRLFAVFFVSAALGISIAIGAGNSLETGPLWLFASHSLIVVVPTSIVAITLLVTRTLGCRLLPTQSAPNSEIIPIT